MKLIVSDLDGTLLNDEKKISEETKLILKKLRLKGIEFAFASGRGIGSITPYRDFLNIDTYFICNNGASIYNKSEKLIYENPIDEKIVKKIITFFRKKNINYNGFYKDKLFIDSLTENKVVTLESQYNIVELKNQKKFPKMIKLIIKGNEKDIISLKNEMTNLFSKFLDITISHPTCLDIVSVNATKGNGIKFLSEKLNISIYDIIAFGDAGNDLDMLQTVGHPVIMKNSSFELKNYIKNQTLSNIEDGVAHYLKEYFSL
ncbi:Cof-type HAD-IIB family hydrolase [Fusobacterium sp. MFO224]|uniref:Cof-type HAD-IIB family hydrolase n=1 Tax=Fusobacterium sp. MFO224 TaxID=3378070 RepID=UPI0038541281